MPRAHVRIAIVGAGFSGLGLAARLRLSGERDLVLLERADEVGGVWRDNHYPGAACDVQSHLYSLSFAPNPRWTRAYSPQGEIFDYLKGVADRFELRTHCRFGEALLEARWLGGPQRWLLRTTRGELTADFFVAATGALSEPSIPALPGRERFGGRVMHSARWDHGVALEGRRVAVVGTGASAIQFIPQLVPRVAALTVFQRTAPWILPRRDRSISARTRRWFEAFPELQRLWRGVLFSVRELMVLGFLHPALMRRAQRMALRYLEETVPDPALRRLLTPGYTLGCKRVLITDDYLPSLTRPNVRVVPQAVRAFTEGGVVSADGAEHPADVVIFGTGFHVTELPIAGVVRGRAGQSLQRVWNGSPRAHLGTTVHGFPNFFILQGPNTGLGHSSVLTMIEAQIEHVLRAIRYVDARGLAAVEPTLEAQSAFVRELDAKLRGTVWNQGGCASWYLDRTGRNSTLWPGFISSFTRRAAHFEPTEYVAIPRHSQERTHA